MAFELHGEQKIGYKRLSDADLGRSGASRQTHIGLTQKVFTYLPNKCEYDDCMLLHDNTIEHLPFYFDRILRANGNYDSPKIRIGEEGESTVARRIRSLVEANPNIANWYLIWFGLKDGRPVFFLLNEAAPIYADIISLGIRFPNSANAVSIKSPGFSRLLQRLQAYVRDVGIDPTEELSVAEKLELAAQISDTVPRELQAFDIIKARENCIKIGAEGEALVNKYFESRKACGEIESFTWVNQERESGLPYDFILRTVADGIVYLDVKTTRYRFEQKMIFSNQEIAFATEHIDKYCIYRVYCDENGTQVLRICNNPGGLLPQIHIRTDAYKTDLIPLADVRSVKFAISPNHTFFALSEPIAL